MTAENSSIHSRRHDAPLTFDNARQLDFFERYPTACSISQVIQASPPETSTRIGVFGEWGEGKTTVLNFVEGAEKTKRNIVVRISPLDIGDARMARQKMVDNFLAPGTQISSPEWLVTQ